MGMVALWRQRQRGPFELEASLVCIASSMGVIETLLICFWGDGGVCFESGNHQPTCLSGLSTCNPNRGLC